MNMKKVKNVVIIIVVVIIVFIMYRYLDKLSKKAYTVTSDDKMFLTSPSNATEPKTIKYKDLPRPINDTSYSLGLWFYIEDWKYKYQQLKHILNKGSVLNHQPSIYLDRIKNILKIKVDVEDSLHEVIEVNDIYMKQWVHLYLNVENTNINVFLNGKLVKSHILSSDIHNNKEDIIVNQLGGFNGLVTKLIVSNDTKSQKDIVAIYKKGPYSSSLMGFFTKLLNNLLKKINKALDLCNK